MISCKELKRRARHSLDRNIFGNSWLFALLACLIISLITGALSGSAILAPATFICYGCFQYGLAVFFLDTSRVTEQKNDINSVFAGFSENIGRNIIAGILYQIFITLWTLLLIIPGIIMSYAYSMTFYILKDHPEYTASQALKASKQMMKGYKMKLFLLDLSFIGWILVSLICCLGVGMLWVTPYMRAAKTEFYEVIKNREYNY